MKVPVCTLNAVALAGSACRLGRARLVLATSVGLLLLNTHSAVAALSFGRGTPTTVGCIRYANSPDAVTITGALTGPGTITSGLNIPANRIQYDLINCDQGTMYSWTIYYSPAVGPNIIGAFTPLGYINSGGVIVPQGGYAYTTLFNAGFGVYNYNTGAPWSIDYEPDHITFTGTTAPPGLPPNDGVGYLNPTPYLTSFAILYDPDLGNGLVPATAVFGTATVNGQVYGPLLGNSCLSIQCTNLVVETCSSCAQVNFSAKAVDHCCTNAVLHYIPASGTCFPVNTTSTVTVIADDPCGNSATNYFTVTVNPGPNCAPTNCITIYSSNLVAYTCNPCTPIPYTAYATDQCCPVAGATLVFNPPAGTCFPLNSSTPVQVTAYDPCGHTNTSTFTVTVLPGPDCGNTNCIRINASNIVAYTCSSCTTVPFTGAAFDQCCTAGGVVLTYNPPTNTCFPLNSTTTVQVKATDVCGNGATKYITVTVLPDPNCNPTNCITIYATNIYAYTCTNCASVPFSASAVDICCASGASLSYNPPVGTCFPVNTTTTVQVTAIDQCGNTAIDSFKVTVLPDPNCLPTNCISIYPSNVVVYICSNCTTVPFTTTVLDPCCSSGTIVSYNPPPTTCFPVNTTTPVQVTAYDQCGNTATNSFTVTVLQNQNCPPTNCISIYPSNIVVYICSNCTTVPFTTTVLDPCCSTGAAVSYNPPATTCFPVNTTTPVQVTAYDQCGNTATNSFTVTVLQNQNCPPTNCVTIYATNIVAYTCSNCTTVPINANVVDTCCAGSVPTVLFNPPVTTCFPRNSTTPVKISAFDSCGNGATNYILVTVVPGPNCAGTNPLNVSGLSGPGPGGTNYITISWPATNGQVQQSSDLLHWDPVPGATNSPYVAPNQAPMKFFRLHYQ